MSSYLSSLTSQYTSLKRLLPTSLSEDQDRNINSESDSHVSRVLRAYYTEKGRPFPAWLGPDPNASSRTTTAALSNAAATTGAGSLRVGRGPSATGGGGLGDLFADSSPPGGGREVESLSLRQRRPGVRSPGFKGGSSDSIPYPQKVAQAPQSQHMRSSSSTSIGDVSVSLPPNVRPLPSQREGSYQSRLGMTSAASNTSFPSTSSNGSYSKENSVQERLKARLGGSKSRGASPILGGSGAPDPPSSSGAGGGEYDPYSSSNYNVGGSSNFKIYENSDGRAGKKNPYGSIPDHRPQYTANSSGSSKAGSSGAPYMAATSPWVSGDDGYRSGSGGASREATSNNYSGGLPGSLLSGRRGPTLPDSPRRRGP
ncbi:hypothetical protein MMC34_005429 [Xylographa carneopallida]|nr:hypothetical protein [Xylographa carneopallida]